jgi:hypothetical protein
MSSTVNLSLRVSVASGPSISISKAVTVEAYDKIDVTVAAGDSDKVVEIQPGASSQVQMLLIKPSEYGETDPTKGLSYKVHDAAATPIVLDQDQLYLGQGQVGLLGAQIDKLLFTNNLAKNVTIEILVGRDATP